MKTNPQNSNTAPAHTARAGAVSASVWETTTERGQQYKVIISRSFRQEAGWQRGHTFYADNLAAVVEAVGKAQRWIQHRQHELQSASQAS